MPNTNPTIVSASLSDKELQDSINKMVANFDKGLQTMLEHSNEYVEKIQASLQKIGNTNFGAKGSNDGAVVKQTKAQNDFTDAVEKNVSARDKQIKKNQEVATSFDQMANAQQKAVSGGRMGIMETYDMQIELFKNRLREVRQDIDIFNAAIGSGKKTQIEWGQQGLKQANAEAEKLMRIITTLENQRGNLANVLAPQGHTIQNYVNSLQKANPELAALNEQFKKGQSALQQQNTEQQKSISYTEEELKKIQTLQDRLQQLKNERKELSRAMQDAGWDRFGAKIQLGAYPDDTNLKNKLIDAENRYAVAKQKIAQVDKEIVSIESEMNGVRSRFAASTQQSAQAQRNLTNETNQQKQTLDDMNAYIRQNIQREQERRDAIRQTGLAAQQSYRGIVQSAREQLEINTEKPIKGVKELGQAIIEMRRAYYDMSDAERLSPIGQSLFNDIKKAEELRKNLDAFNRNITGISFRGSKDFVDVDKSIGSYANLSKLLKELTSEYQKLGRADRNAAKGNELADKIQRIGREAQKVQQQMNRPISFAAAMKGDEKTLDDISYKMQRLRAYKQGIDLTKPNAANEIKQVDEALAKLQKDADKWMSKSQQMIKSNTALGRSWNYMKNRLAFYFTVGASTSFIKNLIEVRSQYEMNERALGILIDSAERGTQIFNELSQMALVSPYTLIELSTAAKQLTAYDVAAKDVVDTTRRLADMAAAVGIPIERLTYALGQIKAYGYLNARDARMFSNAGIPLVKQLAEHYTELEGKMVSTADVYDRIKKKAIDMTDVMQVINKMTDEGGKFFDFQAKMAGTLKVQLANLTLAWNNMLNDIGASEQGTISTGIGLLKELFLQWKNISKMVTNLAIGFGVVKVAQLAYYGVVMGTNKAIALETVLGNRLSNSLRSLASSTNAARMSSTALWVGIATFAAAAFVDILRGNEAMKEFNKTLRENAENTYNDLKKFSENNSSLRESLYKTENGKQTPVDINSEEAKKAWEVLREQIELSSHASDEYIGRLLSIENVSERLRQGFAMIESIQSVSAAIKELGDSSIKLERDWSEWWNLGLLPDGTIGNLQDAYMWLSKIEEKYGSISNARKIASTSRTAEGFDNVYQEEAKEFVENYETELEKFREDLQVTKQSIIDFIELKGWSGDTSKINEAFKTFTDNLILKNQLNPQQAYTLQLEMEEARSKAAKQALLQRINDEKATYKISHDESVRQALNADIERYNNWNETNGRSKVEWERFTKWLKEQHISETTAMFRNMDAEDIKSLNFQEGKHAEWVTRMVTQYAKEHKMSYDDAFKYLKNWVRSANQWSIFIPMTISTEDSKTVYKQLGEYDKAIDEADAQIARLTTRINELNAKKKKSKEETKELTAAENELTQAQKDKADAEAKGGHGKKEKKDEKAANKAAKQAESELQKALKDELSTIEKVRSIYKDLTKEGMSHANAVERATRGWNETVSAINRVLTKNGLQKLDLSKFAGIENPRELVNMLQSQLNTLLKRGAKPAEIKELQTKIQTLNIDAEKYDLTKITKGLNNELGKLKDEYELAVELDANPEMGNLFADWMGIDMSTLPHTAEEYAKRMTKALNKYLADEKSGIEIGDLLSLTDDDLRMFQQRAESGELNQVWVDTIVKNTKEARNALKKENSDIAKEWDSLVQKYSEYEYKIAQVQRNANKERKAFALKYGSNAQKERALVLTTEIDAEKDQAKKQELINQLKQLLSEIAGDNDSKLKIKVAIDKKELEEGARVSFEEFQKSPDWIVATGDLAGMTDKALGMLIKDLEEYKKSASNLSPKQIKELNRALSNLYKQQREGNPFKFIANAMDNARERASAYDQKIADVSNKINDLNQKQVKNGKLTEEEKEAMDKLAASLADLFKKRKQAGKISGKEIIDGLQAMFNWASQCVGMFNQMADALMGDKWSEAKEVLNDTMNTIQSGLQGAQLGAQVGGGWGAAIGGAAGLVMGAISSFFDNSDKKIVAKIKDSEREVKRLENSYKNLEYAIEQAYGMAEYGARRAAIANRQLQLVELQRQLRLEQSRDSKHRDEDRILELKGQIVDLRNEIAQSVDDITNDLLGISSIGDAAEQLVSSMIEAFREGEDYMKQYDESFDKMIDNMIMKAIVSRVVGDRIEQMWNQVKSVAEQRGAGDQKRIEELTKKLSDAQDEAMNAQSSYEQSLNGGWAQFLTAERKQRLDTANKELERIKAQLAQAEKDYAKAIEPTKEDVDSVREMAAGWRDDVKNEFEYWMGAFGVGFGEGADNKQLSSLQQGISQITEVTAQSLEAYANSISQQAYLHSDLLTQIRDAVVGMDMDIQVATQAQMLLQLQQSYQVQMSIESILQGVLVPSGRAFSVELLS